MIGACGTGLANFIGYDVGFMESLPGLAVLVIISVLAVVCTKVIPLKPVSYTHLMYNAVVNDWKDVEPQMTFDVRQPATREYSLKRLRRFLETHEYVDVVRFTTFFHQFTLIFDEMAREKYVDWYGYSASVSPYILEQFEKEAGYPFRPEYIIDQGYMRCV